MSTTDEATTGEQEGTEERESLSWDEGLEKLDHLFDEKAHHEERVGALQHEIGVTLWRMDPQGEEQWSQLAKRYRHSVATLKIWLRTASRLRKPPKGLPFSVMAELARIPDEVTREEILKSKPVAEWTLESMRTTVNKAKFEESERKKPGGPRRTARAGCRLYLDDEHVLHVKASATENMIEVRLEANAPMEVVGEPQKRAEGQVYRVEFTW